MSEPSDERPHDLIESSATYKEVAECVADVKRKFRMMKWTDELVKLAEVFRGGEGGFWISRGFIAQ